MGMILPIIEGFDLPRQCNVLTTGGTAAEKTPCVFPFLYKGTAYPECITLDHEGVPWCSTEYDYDKYKLWGNCQVLTTGGTAPEGSGCVFPFLYGEVEYRSCTTVANRRIPWCATEYDYAANQMWGNCDQTCISTAEPLMLPGQCHMTTKGGMAPEGSACVFPFLYDDRVYTECTTFRNEGVPWCSIEYDYSINKLWGNCRAVTFGGTVEEDSKCVFPFKFMGKSYTGCIISDHTGKPWCATEAEYEEDMHWGYCKDSCLTTVGTTPAATIKSTSVTTEPSVPIAESATAANTTEMRMGNATTPTVTTTTGSTTTTTAPAATTVTTTNTTVAEPAAGNETANATSARELVSTTAYPSCYYLTTGGSAPEGSRCALPFLYKGVEYSECYPSKNGDATWCSIEYDYDSGADWGYCNDECIPVTASENIATPLKEVSTSASSTTTTGSTTAVTTPAGVAKTSVQEMSTSYPGQCTVLTVGGNVPIGSICLFPFLYRGENYTRCTTYKNKGIPWCSTEYDYSVNKLWGNCHGECPDMTQVNEVRSTRSLTTTTASRPRRAKCLVPVVGGTAPEGSQCYFPFIYRGVEYNECTTRNNGGIPWCSVDPVYELRSRWGICREALSCEDTGVISFGGSGISPTKSAASSQHPSISAPGAPALDPSAEPSSSDIGDP